MNKYLKSAQNSDPGNGSGMSSSQRKAKKMGGSGQYNKSHLDFGLTFTGEPTRSTMPAVQEKLSNSPTDKTASKQTTDQTEKQAQLIAKSNKVNCFK